MSALSAMRVSPFKPEQKVSALSAKKSAQSASLSESFLHKLAQNRAKENAKESAELKQFDNKTHISNIGKAIRKHKPLPGNDLLNYGRLERSGGGNAKDDPEFEALLESAFLNDSRVKDLEESRDGYKQLYKEEKAERGKAMDMVDEYSQKKNQAYEERDARYKDLKDKELRARELELENNQQKDKIIAHEEHAEQEKSIKYLDDHPFYFGNEPAKTNLNELSADDNGKLAVEAASLATVVSDKNGKQYWYSLNDLKADIANGRVISEYVYRLSPNSSLETVEKLYSFAVSNKELQEDLKRLIDPTYLYNQTFDTSDPVVQSLMEEEMKNREENEPRDVIAAFIKKWPLDKERKGQDFKKFIKAREQLIKFANINPRNLANNSPKVGANMKKQRKAMVSLVQEARSIDDMPRIFEKIKKDMDVTGENRKATMKDKELSKTVNTYEWIGLIPSDYADIDAILRNEQGYKMGIREYVALNPHVKMTGSPTKAKSTGSLANSNSDPAAEEAELVDLSSSEEEEKVDSSSEEEKVKKAKNVEG